MYVRKDIFNVPFAEKDAAKKLGARWDASLKKWYYKGEVSNYVKFARWIAEGREQTTIVHEHIYIVEGTRKCFRCGKKQKLLVWASENIRFCTKMRTVPL